MGDGGVRRVGQWRQADELRGPGERKVWRKPRCLPAQSCFLELGRAVEVTCGGHVWRSHVELEPELPL